MAAEISDLEEQRARRATARNEFLDSAAPAIRKCVAEVSSYARSGELELLRTASATLDKCIELLFVIAALELEEKVELDERFPLDEHLLEEVESARHRLQTGDIELDLGDDLGSLVASGPRGLYLLALKFMFESALEVGRSGNQIRVNVERSSGKIGVVFRTPSGLDAGSRQTCERGIESLATLRSLFIEKVGAQLRNSGGGLETSEFVASDGSRVWQFRVELRDAEFYGEKS